MHYYFCTPLDIKFLHKGLALYYSCLNHCGNNFTMWILCLDPASHKILRKINLEHAKILTVEDLADNDLLKTRDSRTPAEFAWTSKAPLIIRVLKEIPKNEIVAYLDSDQFLFSSLGDLYAELEGCSIAITPHRFSAKDAYKEKLVGKFNAGMIYMRNDKNARECLDDWRSQCIEWCYGVLDDGKLGDQMYLDNWPQLYKAVYQINNPGINAGTWNLNNFKVTKKDGVIFLNDNKLVWYHFHPLKIYLNKKGEARAYPIQIISPVIYNPYVFAINKSIETIRKYDDENKFRADSKLDVFRLIKQKLIATSRLWTGNLQ